MLSRRRVGCCAVGGMNSDLLSATCLSLLLNTGLGWEGEIHELLSSWAGGDWFEIKSLAVNVCRLLLLVLLDSCEKLVETLKSRWLCMGQGVSLQWGQTGHREAPGVCLKDGMNLFSLQYWSPRASWVPSQLHLLCCCATSLAIYSS